MDFSSWLVPSDLIGIAAVVVITIVARFVLVLLTKRATRLALERAKRRHVGGVSKTGKLLEAVTFGSQERYSQRAATLGAVISSLISVTLAVVAVLTILAILKVPLAPLLASAGVGGIVLAFGAQTVIKDFLSGMFMLMEDQYGVGDLVDTGEVKGTVEDVGLRVTRLRDASGTIWYVRNGEILRLGNQSQGWSTAMVDIPVAIDEDPARVIAILEVVAADAEDAEELTAALLDRPEVAGVTAVTANTMTIHLSAKTKPNLHPIVQRWLLERSLSALAKAGVRTPTQLGLAGE
jgi:moderate conductance mechanosensitive channel